MAVTATIAVVSAAAVGQSMNLQRQSAYAQKQAAETQQRQQRAQATRQRRQAIRAGIRQKQQMAAQAEAAGVQGGSGLAGGQAGVSSQLGANLGFGSMMSGLSQQYTDFTSQAAQFKSQSEIYGQIANIGFQAVPYGSQISGALKSSASTPQPTQTFYPQGQQI